MHRWQATAAVLVLALVVAACTQVPDRPAARGDGEALRPLIGPAFTFSFGPGDDPIAFWRGLEREGLGHPLEIMAAVPRLVYKMAALPPREREVLRAVATDEEIASWTREGNDLGYRLGIREDGTWMFFVAGD